MAFVQVARIPRTSAVMRVVDAGLLMLTGLAVPFVMLAVGAPIAVAIWGLLWLVAKLFG